MELIGSILLKVPETASPVKRSNSARTKLVKNQMTRQQGKIVKEKTPLNNTINEDDFANYEEMA